MKLPKYMPPNKGEKGFTLVELLIVVIILAVLAAIVIPQFTSSTDEAKDAALKTTLSEMRNAIELYYHQHNSTYPGFNKAADGTAGGAASDFTAQLTLYTSVTGQTANTKDVTYKYGPYLKKSVLPSNPVDGLNTLVLNSGLTVGDITATGTAAGGWWFDTTSGKFLANIAAYYTY
ncbi:MAG: type II secretion system protein [Nitrospinota bacterium]